MERGYKRIANEPEGIYKEKGSKFIGYGFHVRNQDELKAAVEKVKKMHPKSRHFCYGCVLGDNYETHLVNDDGEPSGTAGKPILNQILSVDYSYTAVIVIRYFGGTKLGTTGLIRSYKTAAEEALKQSTFKEIKILEILVVRFGYEQTANVNLILQKAGAISTAEQYQERCVLEVAIGAEVLERVKEELKLLSFVELESLGPRAVGDS